MLRLCWIAWSLSSELASRAQMKQQSGGQICNKCGQGETCMLELEFIDWDEMLLVVLLREVNMNMISNCEHGTGIFSLVLIFPYYFIV